MNHNKWERITFAGDLMLNETDNYYTQYRNSIHNSHNIIILEKNSDVDGAEMKTTHKHQTKGELFEGCTYF